MSPTLDLSRVPLPLRRELRLLVGFIETGSNATGSTSEVASRSEQPPPAAPASVEGQDPDTLWLSLDRGWRGRERGLVCYRGDPAPIPLKPFKLLLHLAVARTLLGAAFVPQRPDAVKRRETDVHRTWAKIVEQFPALALGSSDDGFVDDRTRWELIRSLGALAGTLDPSAVVESHARAFRLGRAFSAVEFDLDALLGAADQVVVSLARGVADHRHAAHGSGPASGMGP